MNYEFIFLQPASIELEEAFIWYERKKSGLGIEFIEELDYYLKLIQENPFLFEANEFRKNLRRVPLNRFPFVIIYWIDESKSKIYIDAVFHTKRNPKF